jgi:hypothetical protein
MLPLDKARRSGRVLHDNARCIFTKRDEVEHIVFSSDEEAEDFEELPDDTIDLSPWVVEVRFLLH